MDTCDKVTVYFRLVVLYHLEKTLMNPVYLMQGLGLDTPILEAILEGLPATRAFRRIVSLLLEIGFSLFSDFSNSVTYGSIFILHGKFQHRVIVWYARNGKMFDIHYVRFGAYIEMDLKIDLEGKFIFGHQVHQTESLENINTLIDNFIAHLLPIINS